MVLRVLRPMNHLRAGIGLLVVVSYCHAIKLCSELSPVSMHDGYFHVIALPVSTCVHESLLPAPLQLPRLVTKL